MCICANSRSFCLPLQCGQVFYLNLLVLEAKPFRHPGHTPPGHLDSAFGVWSDHCWHHCGVFFWRGGNRKKTWQFFLGSSGNSFVYFFFLAVSGNRATPLREHDLGFSALHDLDQSDAVIPVRCERFERQVIRRSLIQIHLVHFDSLQGSARCYTLAFWTILLACLPMTLLRLIACSPRFTRMRTKWAAFRWPHTQKVRLEFQKLDDMDIHAISDACFQSRDFFSHPEICTSLPMRWSKIAWKWLESQPLLSRSIAAARSVPCTSGRTENPGKTTWTTCYVCNLLPAFLSRYLLGNPFSWKVTKIGSGNVL